MPAISNHSAKNSNKLRKSRKGVLMEDKMIKCPSCGEQVPAGTENCPKCGAPIGVL